MTRLTHTSAAISFLRASTLHDDLPSLRDRLAAEKGWSVERVAALYRQAGGQRWKASVGPASTSSCAEALMAWLEIGGSPLAIYSRLAIQEAGDGNGRKMTRRVLRQLHGTDQIVVVDPATDLGAALLSGECEPVDDWVDPFAVPPLPDLDHRVRIANMRDVRAVYDSLHSWAGGWIHQLDF